MFFCEARQHPETIGSNIMDFVCILRGQFTVNFVVVCQILNRATACLQHPNYNLGVQVLNDYLKVVLEPVSSRVLELQGSPKTKHPHVTAGGHSFKRLEQLSIIS